MPPAPQSLQPRVMGAVNWLGLWTLYTREVRRFIKVHQQTVWAPVVTTLLFYAVFALALGGASRMVGGVPYMEFLAPGLIMMAMTQNAFANTSSSIVISKVQGNIVDILMPPMSPGELAVGFVMGGVTRGLCVGLVTAAAIALFVPIKMAHPGFIVFHAVMASMMLSLIGFIGGVWSDKFDNIAAVTNFVVTPLSFLSGTFYSVGDLPPFFWWAAHFDPFFYMIDGIRYGFIGHADGHLGVGVAVMLFCNAGLWWLAWKMLSTGYKLKS
jgi:ABC-2 type transport system permease protein